MYSGGWRWRERWEGKTISRLVPQVQASMTFHLSSDGKEFQEDKNIFKGKKGKDRK